MRRMAMERVPSSMNVSNQRHTDSTLWLLSAAAGLAVTLATAWHAGATTIAFDGAAAGNNADIPLDYGSFIGGDATGFVTTDGTGATPNIGLSWVGNRPNEWEYHTGDAWQNYKTPVHVAQIDHNRGGEFDDITEIVFSPINGRTVEINSFVLIGGSGQGGTAIYDWEVLGTSTGGTLNIAPGTNTGAVPVNFSGAPGTSYTLRFTHDPAGDDNNIGTALDDLSFSESLAANAEVLRLTIDRGTGAITLTNVGTTTATIKGYSILSDVGALDTAGWKSIADHYDVSGDGSVDSNDNWTELSIQNTGYDLSEYQFVGDGGTLAPSQSVALSQPSGGAWAKHPVEDVELEVLMPDGRRNRYSVDYVNGPAGGYEVGDLNFDGTVNALDWPVYNSGRGVDMDGLSPAQAYRLGDLDGDLDNDIVDFVTFKGLFEAANGSGSFARLLAIPEPSSLGLVLLGAGLIGLSRLRRNSTVVSVHGRLKVGMLLSAVLACTSFGSSALATTLTFADSPGNNADLPTDYGSNVSTDSAAFVTSDGTGATPNIALTWAPTTEPFTNALEFQSASGFANAGFTVPVLQFDLDVGTLPNPTIDFTVTNGSTFKLNGFEIGNGTGQTADPYAWQIDLIRLTDMQVVASRTTGLLGPGSRETVTFDYTGIEDEDYRLTFDDGGADTVNTAIDNLSFSQLDIDVPALKLVVNTIGGTMSIVNDSGESFDIDSYEIRSPSGSLNPAGWQSLQQQDYEGNGPPVNGNGWEEAGGVDQTQLIESYFAGSSVLTSGMPPISLGSAFDTTGMMDIEFEYHVLGTGGVLLSGDVEYVSISVDGDYNSDGLVNVADYTVWRDSLGQTGPNLPADGNNDNAVTTADYTYWKSRFGNSAASASVNAAAVPEPAGFALAALFLGTMAVCGRRGTLPSMTTFAAVLLASCVAAGPSSAARTIDRLYRFGDDPDEAASVGAVLGGGSQTLDSQSVTGSPSDVDAQNLNVNSDPRYVNVGPTVLQRPGAGAGEFGVEFDGVDDVLDGDPLNRPDETAGPTPIGLGPIIESYPFNYDRITARGLQMWVYPDQAAIGQQLQTIVFDTVAAGGVRITSDGKWSQVFDSVLDEGLIPATAPVVGNQWHHVMQHIYRTTEPGGPRLADGAVDDDGFTSVVYVDGIAVSAENGSPRPGQADNGNRFFRLAVGAEETSSVTFVTPEFINHFDGVVDDLEMYVYGDNSAVSTSPAGQDYGTFNLLEDNGWILSQIASIPGGILKDGDINFDGVVDQADVTSFVAGWQREKRISGSMREIMVADWETRGWGDLNLDGIVDLDDAFLLDQALTTAGAGRLDFDLLYSTSVPEPSALMLAVLLTGGGLLRARTAGSGCCLGSSGASRNAPTPQGK